MSPIELLSPPTISALDKMLEEYPGTRLLAGATDLMPLLKRRQLPAERLIDLQPLRAELDFIREDEDRLAVGCLTTIAAVAASERIAEGWPLLTRAARELGAAQIQNMATIGGNIANASPAADMVPPLLVYDARLLLQSMRGKREVPLGEFFHGYKELELQPDEWIREVRLVEPPPAREFYSKTGARRAQAIAKLSLAALIGGPGEPVCRVAAGALSPFPRRLHEFERYLLAQVENGDTPQERELRRLIEAELAPIDDIRSSATYRLRVAQNLLCNFIREAGFGLA